MTPTWIEWPQPGCPKAARMEVPEDEMGPTVALIGTLDSGRLGDRLTVAAVVNHLRMFQPAPEVRLLAPVGGASEIDGGIPAAAGADLGPEGLRALVNEVGLVVVLPSAVLSAATSVDLETACELLAGTYSEHRADFPDVEGWAALLLTPPTMPRLRPLRAGVAEMAGLSANLFGPELRGRRTGFLRRLGWLPEGNFVAVEADRDGALPREAVAPLEKMGCARGRTEVVLFRTDGRLDPVDLGVAESEGLGMIGLEPRASLADIAATLATADQVMARSPEAVALAAVLRGAPPPPRSLPAVMELALGRVGGLAMAGDAVEEPGSRNGQLMAALDAARGRERSMRLSAADLLWQMAAEKAALERQIEQLQDDRDMVTAELQRVRSTKVMRYSELPRQAFSKLRSAPRGR